MIRIKKRTFSGAVCEQEVFTVSSRAGIKKAEYEPRIASDEERARHRLEISRRNHTRLVNANFSPSSLYSTLTFDEENECHDWESCRKLRDLYVRRLKRAYPNAVIFIYCGQGKATHRWHMHMLSEGLPEAAIAEKWGFGTMIRIEHLRAHVYYDGEDHGADYTSLANYLFDHWTPDQGCHRWKMTKNAKRPESEAPKEAKRNYSIERPPQAPRGFRLVEARSNSYGYLYFKYVADAPDEKRYRPRQQDIIRKTE